MSLLLQAHRSDWNMSSFPVAYLVNQYPLVSLTFIRREIHALERQGVKVERIALRSRDNHKLVDALDIEEKQKTRRLLR